MATKKTTSKTDSQDLREDFAQLRKDLDQMAGTLKNMTAGAAESARENVSARVEQGRKQAAAAEKEVVKRISDNPWQAVGIAFGAGFLISRLSR